ncbi:MAG: DNA-processing protein DprA [Kiritimatiellia bacterium]
MTDREAYVAFNLTEQVGSVKVGQLVEQFGSVTAAWENYPKKVSRTGGEVDWQAEFKKAEKFGVTIVTPADEAYPELLRTAPGRPLALYVKGDVAALSKPAVAIVGTRRVTPYGADQAAKFAHDLAANGWMILSGLALGVDAEAHRAALDAGGVTVGILGSGLDQFYPPENRELAREMVRKGGAVVSEFPFGRTPDTQTFPQRNHVVAALAKGVLAIEAPPKSGTLITTGIAADLGRTVMAVPGRVDSRSSAGCLALIRDGARLVRHARDVEEELCGFLPGLEQPLAKKAGAKAKKADAVRDEASAPAVRAACPPPPFSLEEALVMKHVDAEGVSMDRLVQLTKLPAAKVNALCMALRLKGRVRFFPGNRVALPRAS